MAPKQVSLLVVEDDDVDFKLLMHSFSKRKIANAILRAKNGLDALSKIENGEVQEPFFVLLDINMPKMNGWEFLEALRANPKHAHTVVFINTTSNDEVDIKKGFEEHVAGYFHKDNVSHSIDKLVEVIDGYWQIVVMPQMRNSK